MPGLSREHRQPSAVEMLDNYTTGLIFQELYSFHPSKLLASTLTCKAWHSVAQPMFQRQLVFDFRPVRPREHIKKVLAALEVQASFRKNVRITIFRNWISPAHNAIYMDAPAWFLMERITQVLRRLSLERVVWNSTLPIPGPIDKVLKRQNRPLLEIECCDFNSSTLSSNFFRSITTKPSIVPLVPLASSLRRLEVIISSEDHVSLCCLARLITSTTQLDNLYLYIAGRTKEHDAYISAGAIPSFVETIKGSEASQLPRLTSLTLRNICVCNEECSHSWLDTIQLSFLRRVRFTCAAFLIRFAKQLQNVRYLTLDLDAPFESVDRCCPRPPLVSDIKNSFFRLTELESLELRNATATLDEPLLVHLGKTLRNLSVHSDQDPASLYHEGMKENLTLDEVNKIAEHCIWLRRMCLDVTRDQDSLWAMIDLISERLLYLMHIELKFDGYPGENWPDRPSNFVQDGHRSKINYDFCALLWQRLHAQGISRRQRTSSPRSCNLSSLTVRVGSPVRKDSWCMEQQVYRQQRTYEIRKPDANDGAPSVFCAEIEAARGLVNEVNYRPLSNPLELIARTGEPSLRVGGVFIQRAIERAPQ